MMESHPSSIRASASRADIEDNPFRQSPFDLGSQPAKQACPKCGRHLCSQHVGYDARWVFAMWAGCAVVVLLIITLLFLVAISFTIGPSRFR
jgi:hypothetical protein